MHACGAVPGAARSDEGAGETDSSTAAASVACALLLLLLPLLLPGYGVPFQ
jgi:hypothetical protein